MQKEIERIVSQYSKEKASDGSFDLESFEMSIRSGMHGIGGKMLETLLNANGGHCGATLPGENNHAAVFVEYRKKKLLTILGEVTVNRAYYHDKEGHFGFCPKDEALDIVG